MGSFLRFLLISLAFSSQIANSLSSDPIQDRAEDGNGPLVVKRILIHPGQSDGSFVQLQNLREKHNAEFTPIDHRALSGLDDFSPTMTPQEGEPDTLGNDTVISSLRPSKTTPQEQAEEEEVDGDDLGPSEDHYDPLEKRSEPEEGILEARHRVRCPAQPRPSARCACKDQTYCRGKRGVLATCVKLKIDHENCGSCRNRCGNTQYCTKGRCRCNRPRFTACGRSCVNLRNNEDHCGRCNNRCRRGKTCQRGVCKRN
ncbi:hypothetical protein CPB86DRAFT_627680 [Serendipita vermifera]|nr:hypothetical protein CPB86DRAFT_627680 [Serendipita vermifera]